MSKQLYKFFANTKQVHIGLSIALLLILIFMVAPLNLGHTTIKIGQTIIVGILTYIIYLNFTETRIFAQTENKKKGKEDKEGKNNDKDKDNEVSLTLDTKHNILLSYTLSGFMILLLLYVVYSMF
jgi:DNA integrity scanning protein DisA with diadenylate cyclase activity